MEEKDIIETTEPAAEVVAEEAAVEETVVEEAVVEEAVVEEVAVEETVAEEPIVEAAPKNDDVIKETAAKVDAALDGAVDKVLGDDDDGHKLSIAAIILGAAGIVLGGVPFIGFLAFICAILGIILGIKGRKKSVAATGKASGLATAGLILGIAGIAFGVLGLACSVCSVVTCIIGAASNY